jgi:hypothetical protein
VRFATSLDCQWFCVFWLVLHERKLGFVMTIVHVL